MLETAMNIASTTSLAFFNFSGWELAIILVLGLLIFGRRLPELGRSVGRTIVEFKKGLADVQSEVHHSSTPPAGQGTAPTQSLPGGQPQQQGQQAPQANHEKRG